MDLPKPCCRSCQHQSTPMISYGCKTRPRQKTTISQNTASKQVQNVQIARQTQAVPSSAFRPGKPSAPSVSSVMNPLIAGTKSNTNPQPQPNQIDPLQTPLSTLSTQLKSNEFKWMRKTSPGKKTQFPRPMPQKRCKSPGKARGEFRKREDVLCVLCVLRGGSVAALDIPNPSPPEWFTQPRQAGWPLLFLPRTPQLPPRICAGRFRATTGKSPCSCREPDPPRRLPQ
jgi:hypothetical protein